MAIKHVASFSSLAQWAINPHRFKEDKWLFEIAEKRAQLDLTREFNDQFIEKYPRTRLFFIVIASSSSSFTFLSLRHLNR